MIKSEFCNRINLLEYFAQALHAERPKIRRPNRPTAPHARARACLAEGPKPRHAHSVQIQKWGLPSSMLGKVAFTQNEKDEAFHVRFFPKKLEF